MELPPSTMAAAAGGGEGWEMRTELPTMMMEGEGEMETGNGSK